MTPTVRRDKGDELIIMDIPHWPFTQDPAKIFRCLLTDEEAYALARALLQECQDREIENRNRTHPFVRAAEGADEPYEPVRFAGDRR